MVVNVGFLGSASRSAGPISRRPRPYTVNLKGDAMKQHERAMGYRHEAAKLDTDLRSALSSLSSANAEIDRLSARVRELETELAGLKLKAEKAEKSEKPVAVQDVPAQEPAEERKPKKLKKAKAQTEQAELYVQE